MVNRRAPESVLIALAEAVTALNDHPSQAMREHVDNCIAAYRAAIAPVLRTLDERNRELLGVILGDTLYADGRWHMNSGVRERIAELLCEPTRPDSSPGDESTGRECEWCQDSTRPELSQHLIPARIVHVCKRCLDERGFEAGA